MKTSIIKLAANSIYNNGMFYYVDGLFNYVEMCANHKMFFATGFVRGGASPAPTMPELYMEVINIVGSVHSGGDKCIVRAGLAPALTVTPTSM